MVYSRETVYEALSYADCVFKNWWEGPRPQQKL